MQLHGEYVIKNRKQKELEDSLLAELDERLNLTEEEKNAYENYSPTYRRILQSPSFQARAQVGGARKTHEQIELEAYVVTYIVQRILLELTILTREQEIFRVDLMSDSLSQAIRRYGFTLDYGFTWNLVYKNKIFVAEIIDTTNVIIKEIFGINLDSNKKIIKYYEEVKREIKRLREVIHGVT